MTPDEVKEELAIEAEAVEVVLAELDSLHRDVGQPGPTTRELAAAGLFLAPYRRFRHVVHHGYGFQLRWEDMLPGIEAAPNVWSSLRAVLESYLAELDTGGS